MRAPAKLSSELLVKLITSEFEPRAPKGWELSMMRGIEAEEGDIVATGEDDGVNFHIEYYRPETPYFAVAVGIYTPILEVAA